MRLTHLVTYMKISREYEPKNLNWKLLPDILAKFRAAIPEDERIEAGMPKRSTLVDVPSCEVSTFSQSVELPSVQELLSFIEGSAEDPVRVDIYLDCKCKWEDGNLFDRLPPYFKFSWKSDRVFVQIARNTSSQSLELLEELEGLLQLTPAAPPKQENPARNLKRTVFIAHSFDDAGRSYAFQLTKVLSLLGFEVATGEGYAPESVSSKVRRRLAAQEIAVAIVSERDDMTWLIQEATAVDFSGKPLILMVEEGATFKLGILGDLEYIKFPRGHISESIPPLIEGLRELGFTFSHYNAPTATAGQASSATRSPQR